MNNYWMITLDKTWTSDTFLYKLKFRLSHVHEDQLLGELIVHFSDNLNRSFLHHLSHISRLRGHKICVSLMDDNYQAPKYIDDIQMHHAFQQLGRFVIWVRLSVYGISPLQIHKSHILIADVSSLFVVLLEKVLSYSRF